MTNVWYFFFQVCETYFGPIREFWVAKLSSGKVARVLNLYILRRGFASKFRERNVPIGIANRLRDARWNVPIENSKVA
jgi:hypothetical protein